MEILYCGTKIKSYISKVTGDLYRWPRGPACSCESRVTGDYAVKPTCHTWPAVYIRIVCSMGLHCTYAYIRNYLRVNIFGYIGTNPIYEMCYQIYLLNITVLYHSLVVKKQENFRRTRNFRIRLLFYFKWLMVNLLWRVF